MANLLNGAVGVDEEDEADGEESGYGAGEIREEEEKR